MKKRIFALLLALCLLPTLCPAVFAAEGAGPVRVAVIDTGISTAAIAPEHLAEGRNYIRPQDTTEDKLGHGTAISGIITGSAAAGLPGVCPQAVLIPLVWCSQDENGNAVKGETDMVAQAIYDAIDIYGCRIINLSFGTLADPVSLRKAVDYAEERGALVVSAAGNSGESAPEEIYYPGAYDTVLCIGAANRDGTAAAGFSQRNDTVDLLAPGDNLRVASIKGTCIRGSGTSYAAAYASGAAARLLSEDPSLTAAQLRELMQTTARDIGPSGYDMESGWGILDLDAALARLRGGRLFPFTDVPEDAWYREAVEYAHTNGLMAGTAGGTFAPDAGLTRGMLVTILHRMENRPAAPVSGFSDVESGKWYAEAINWAAANGIVVGYSDGRFGPDDSITREQLAVILYRYAGYKNDDIAAGADLSFYADASAIGAYAKDALAWANGKGLINGDGNLLMPQGQATRAQTAAILMRLAANMVK